MTRLSSTLEIGVDNNASRPINQIDRDLDQLRRSADSHGRAMADARGKLFDAAAAGWALYRALEAPISAGLEFETMLEDIGQKTDLTRGQIAEMGREIRALGLSTAQGASEVGKSVDLMMGYGFSEDVGMTVAEPIGKAATAYTAATEDLAGAASVLIGNLRVPAEEVGYALDIMAKGGKEGAFELRDMAAEFPALTASAQALGISGTKGTADLVAMLEVARKGAATGAIAANNTANFMGKILAPDVITKFGKAGIDIVEELNQATAAGKSPIERALVLIDKLTEGGKQDLLGGLFADKQVQEFIRPLLANMDEYRRIRDSALDSAGTIDADFQERMDGPAGTIKRFTASVENLNIVIGQQLLPKLTELVGSVTPVIDGLAAFVEANGELTSEIATIVAAMVGLRILAAAATWGGAFMGMGSAGAVATGSGVGAGVTGGVATAAGTAGWLAAGKAFANTAFGKMASGFALFELARQAQEHNVLAGPQEGKSWDYNVVHTLDPTLAKMLYEGYNPLPGMGSNLASYGDKTLTGGPESGEMASIRQMLAENDSGAVPLHPIELTALKEQLAQLEADAAAAGTAAGTSLQAGFGAQMPSVAAEMQSVMDRLRVIAASGVTIPLRTGPTVAPAPSRMIDGARARGGEVWPGGAFLVGEEGPEVVTFDDFGMVHSAGSTAAMLRPPAANYPTGGNGSGQGSSSSSIVVGDIHVSLGMMNASDPKSVAREIAGLVKSEIEAAFSDAAMA